MTKDEALAINRRVAELLGAGDPGMEWAGGELQLQTGWRPRWRHHGDLEWRWWNPAEEWRDAGSLLEWLAREFGFVRLDLDTGDDGMPARVSVDPPPGQAGGPLVAWAPTAPEAITRAVAAALEAE